MRPSDADVLIAGGGLAAQRCCETLRRLGFDGRIVVLCEEHSAPYDRPPLSKAFLTGDDECHPLAIKPQAWYVEHDVELLLGVAAKELDAAGRRVTLGELKGAERPSHGGTLRYGSLVVATGSRPRRLPGMPLGPTVHELRTHADAVALRAGLRNGSERLAVLGSGLVGMEVASSARALGLEVTLIEAGATPLGRALPPTLGLWMAQFHREEGVDVRLNTCVRGIDVRDGSATLDLSDGSTVDADNVLVAAGTVPATEWLAGNGLEPGQLHTDEGGQTRLHGVYAAGDAACFPDAYSGERVPTPHWEAAVRQGIAVAHSILGRRPPVPAPAMFWSDQHNRRIQFVGHAPSECEIELDHAASGRAEQATAEKRLADAAGAPFVAWIRHHGRPVAAMLVGRPDALGRARRWIADAGVERSRRAA